MLRSDFRLTPYCESTMRVARRDVAVQTSALTTLFTQNSAICLQCQPPQPIKDKSKSPLSHHLTPTVHSTQPRLDPKHHRRSTRAFSLPSPGSQPAKDNHVLLAVGLAAAATALIVLFTFGFIFLKHYMRRKAKGNGRARIVPDADAPIQMVDLEARPSIPPTR